MINLLYIKKKLVNLKVLFFFISNLNKSSKMPYGCLKYDDFVYETHLSTNINTYTFTFVVIFITILRNPGKKKKKKTLYFWLFTL